MKDMSGVSSVEKEPGKLISADDVQEISPNQNNSKKKLFHVSWLNVQNYVPRTGTIINRVKQLLNDV